MKSSDAKRWICIIGGVVFTSAVIAFSECSSNVHNHHHHGGLQAGHEGHVHDEHGHEKSSKPGEEGQ